MCEFQRSCLPSSPRQCYLQFGEFGGFVWRELYAFGRLRQALVYVQTKNSLGHRPRLSSTHTQPYRPLRTRLFHLGMAVGFTRAFSPNLSTTLRPAQTRNTGSFPVFAPEADHNRTYDSEQIRAAAIAQHTEYKSHEAFNEGRVGQR